VKSFLKNLFGKSGESLSEPDIHFGRHSDFYKSKDKYDDWDLALEKHNKKQFLDSITHFLSYISNDVNENVQIEHQNGEKIKFSIFQGSKKIEGFANQDGFFAESKIAKCKKISLGALRSLLEENYQLRYSSYSLDSENNITIVMHTDYIDASPYKLYYGLKEIATLSDRRDDVMISKFVDLDPIQNGYITPIPLHEKEVKYDFLKSIVEDTLTSVKRDVANLKEHPGLVSYRILGTVLLIDYFLKPESMLMEHIENIHKIFFHINTLSPDQKNIEMTKELSKIKALDKDKVMMEMYNTKSTFGILVPGNHLRLQELVDQDMKHFEWYIANGYEAYASYIPQYVAGILLYTYAMPLPDKKLLHLILRIWNNDFFVKLGYESLIKDGVLDKAAILNQIKKASHDARKIYEPVDIDVDQLKFTNIYTFTKTYFDTLYHLIIKKKD
jgi:hypothetical protein